MICLRQKGDLRPDEDRYFALSFFNLPAWVRDSFSLEDARTTATEIKTAISRMSASGYCIIPLNELTAPASNETH